MRRRGALWGWGRGEQGILAAGKRVWTAVGRQNTLDAVYICQGVQGRNIDGWWRGWKGGGEKPYSSWWGKTYSERRSGDAQQVAGAVRLGKALRPRQAWGWWMRHLEEEKSRKGWMEAGESFYLYSRCPCQGQPESQLCVPTVPVKCFLPHRAQPWCTLPLQTHFIPAFSGLGLP